MKDLTQKPPKHPHLAPFTLLGTPPDTCPECAVKHEPGAPHNAQSLAYQYDFYGKHGRWPTWGDALAHCAPELQAKWRDALRKKGVKEEQLRPSADEPLAPPMPKKPRVTFQCAKSKCDSGEDLRWVRMRVPHCVNIFSLRKIRVCAKCRKKMRGQFKYADRK